MSDLIIKKNGTDYKLPMLAEHYPADRVYRHGNVNDDLETAMDNLENGVVIHTANANQTYGEQMAEIAPYFSNLTQGQKMRTLLKSGNSLYPCVSTLGIFSLTATGATSISLQSFRLDSIKLFIATNGTVEDFTTRTATNTLSLIVL